MLGIFTLLVIVEYMRNNSGKMELKDNLGFGVKNEISALLYVFHELIEYPLFNELGIFDLFHYIALESLAPQVSFWYPFSSLTPTPSSHLSGLNDLYSFCL